MPTTIGTAYVQILPTTEGITNNLTGLLSGPTAAAGEAGGKNMGSGLLKGLGAGAAAIGAAATAAVGGIVDMANQAAQAGDAIDKQSQKLGVSAEQYQAMAYAAEHSGFSVETFGTAAKTLANTDFAGNVWDAVEAIQAIEDPAERAAAAQELLGTRAALEMAPLINGAMTIDDYRSSLEALGGMMSNEAVAASAAYEDALTDMNTALNGVKNGLVADFLPSMTDVINGVALLASGSTEGISQIEEGFNTFMDGLMEKIPTIIETGGELAMTLGEAIMEHIPEILEIGGTLLIELATGIAGRLPELIPRTVEIIMTIVNGLIQNMPALIQAALQLIVGLATGLVQAIPTLVTYIPQIVRSIATAFIQAVPEIAEAGWQLIAGLADGIVQGLGAVWDTITGVARSIVNGIKNFFGIHSPSTLFRDEVGMQLMAGMAAGIMDNEDMVEDAMSDVEDLVGSGVSMNVVPAGGGTGSRDQDVLNQLLEALRNTKFEFYLDGKCITDSVTLHQRREVRARGYA